MTEICLFIITAKFQMVIFIIFCFKDTVHELLDHPSYIMHNFPALVQAGYLAYPGKNTNGVSGSQSSARQLQSVCSGISLLVPNGYIQMTVLHFVKIISLFKLRIACSALVEFRLLTLTLVVHHLKFYLDKQWRP